MKSIFLLIISLISLNAYSQTWERKTVLFTSANISEARLTQIDTYKDNSLISEIFSLKCKNYKYYRDFVSIEVISSSKDSIIKFCNQVINDIDRFDDKITVHYDTYSLYIVKSNINDMWATFSPKDESGYASLNKNDLVQIIGILQKL